ncbi:XRE family transcriptional regulator [Streptomyces armeniacus]|uniref:XRE family transcriptional regulator n=1 Tax=Streptomyces armeniacus TaxID=83291 RepID=A0A345XYI5_9ACTN|nr:helix-turn-helix transcriptional regulator [Streptomyces armeniacus]AXK36701.1 XRE family transcriptional regulator [Streptomyces armeniacus]
MHGERGEDGVAALLAEARLAAAFSDPGERARLRKAAGFSLEQFARAVAEPDGSKGVGRQTIANWESGGTSSSPAFGRYLRLLEGLAQIHPAPRAEAEGEAAPAPAQAAAPAPAQAGRGESESAESPAAREARAGHARHRAQRRTGSADDVRAQLRETIAAAVDQELEKAGGDADAASAALTKRAIPDVMALFTRTRAGARYEYTAYPALPDILRKPSKTDPDLIWEGRPSWRHPGYRRHPDGGLGVTALDVNAAYLSALKTWLPIGKLEHSRGGEHDRKRAGVHLITPTPWEHPHLPSPLGDREEEGPLWITEPTLRLLLRLSGPKHSLLAPPVIHESWTSSATETFLDSLRQLLASARADALAAGDDVTAGYVKAMYSKFVSTMGESSHNREMVRPDWMHLIRSQAFGNLWNRAFKAYQAGLTVISALGTDELHVAGEWRQVWDEGRGLAEMKIKTDRNGAPVRYTVTEAG